MSKDYTFSVMPSVSISRSRFARTSQHKTSFNLGDIVPIYVDEVLPGDTRSFDMASLVRMSTPIAPIMDNIYMDYFAFFVPNRIIWNHWKEFMGENNSSAGIPNVTYTIPYMNTSYQVASGSPADYMGLPVGVGYLNVEKISALPFRAYYAIYNRWFRNQNVIAPIPVDTTDANEAVVGSTNKGLNSGDLCKASKLPDYFTKGLPYAQKGTAVSLPLGTTAPILFNNSGSTVLRDSSGNIITGSSTPASVDYANSHLVFNNSHAKLDNSGQLVADLRNATAATINELRYAFQLQKFLEKDALYGTRYWELLAAHFGVQAPDASLQDPEYLGGFRQQINIDQVLSTAGYDDSTAQDVGKPGANSVTGGKSSLFTKSFCEHGWLMIVAVGRHDQTYSQGLNRMWTRQARTDYYWPVFANLGAQAILNKEIYVGTSAAANNLVFGYQEAWAEYRYKPSIATGLLNPNVTGSLDFWTLANKFGSLPTLGQTFMEQDRDNIKRALVTGTTGPDFICDFYFKDVAVRPMPLYSIPGLIDHH